MNFKTPYLNAPFNFPVKFEPICTWFTLQSRNKWSWSSSGWKRIPEFWSSQSVISDTDNYLWFSASPMALHCWGLDSRNDLFLTHTGSLSHRLRTWWNTEFSLILFVLFWFSSPTRNENKLQKENIVDDGWELQRSLRYLF